MNPEPNTSHHSSQCERIGGDLKSYLDNELSPGRRLVVQFHLVRCKACREELSWMQALTNELEKEQNPTATLNESLRTRILDSAPIQTPTTNVTAPNQRSIRPQLALRGGAVLAVASVLFVITTSLNSGTSQGTFGSAANTINDVVNHDFAAPAASSSSRAASDWSDAPSPGKSDRSEAAAPPTSADAVAAQSPLERKVHKEGRITVAVDDVEAQSLTVESMIKGAGGYLSSNALTTGANNLKTATLDVRVPVDKFESAIREISKLGEVRDKSVSGEDITESFVTAKARRQTLAQELSIREAQLREKERNAKKRDANALWQLRAEVRNLRVQAAEARARLQMTQKLADLANLSVTLQQKPDAVKTAGFTESLGETGREAWASFVAAARLPLQLLIWMLAYSPFWLPALLLWRKFGRRWLASH